MGRQGKEFYNKSVKDVIDIYSTENEEKSSVVERFNRTIKEKIFKYFSANNTNRYIHVIDDIVKKYNNTKHSSIKMTPEEASKGEDVVKVKGKAVTKEQRSKFKLGDYVRIPRKKGVFEKGYTTRWTEEVFKIVETLHTSPVTYS